MEDFKVYQASGYLTKLVTDASDVRKTYEEISGSLVEFDTYISAPLAELVVDINPVQDLHGQDAPYPAGGGKNKLQNLQTTQTISGVTFTVYDDGSVNVNGTASDLVVFCLNDILQNYLTNGQSYILSGSPINSDTSKWKLRVYNSGVDSIDAGSGVTFTFFSTAEAKKCDIVIYSGTTMSNVLFKPMIRLSSVADGTFAPYSNICPITGWTGANIYHSGEDTSDPTTYTISWQDVAGTVYGGTVDLVSGVLTVTDAEIASYNGETLPSTWISDRDVYAVGTTPTIGAQVVYKISTPTEIQLTPQEINTLIGVNNIWADTGDVSVKYRTH